jgi:protein translocase SecG subunit
MIKALIWLEFILSALIIGSILLQHRGTGLGGAFASEGNAYRSMRGIEKFLYNSTIILGVLLVLSALAHLFIRLKLAV